MKALLITMIMVLMASPAMAAVHGAMAEAGVEAGMQANASAEANSERSDEDIRTGARIMVQNNEAATTRVGADNELRASAAVASISERIRTQGSADVEFSNGARANVMVMPEVAAQTAIERLRMNICSEENNCTVELRVVGNASGNMAGDADSNGSETRVAYEVRANKEARMFGLFRVDMPVQAQVDAETGAVIESKKPWWAFLATEARAETNAQANAQTE